MTKYLVLGGGYLGNKIANLPGAQLSTQRINTQQDADQLVQQPCTHIINCIGKTGRPNVDWCESNKEATLHSNVQVPLYLALSCKKYNKQLVHLGTGCIYEGTNKSGFTEQDTPNFTQSYYSRTKYQAEQILSDFNALQIRVRMPIDTQPHPRNLITKVLSYNKIINYPNSVTYVPELLKAILSLIQANATGIYNITNPGPISIVDIFNAYNLHAKNKKEFEIISLNQLHQLTTAKRSNTILDSAKVQNIIQLSNMQEILPEILKKYVKKGITSQS